MARVNPEVERLQAQVDAYRRIIERMRQDPPDIPFTACDHSCVVATATGQAPNGGCRCDERKLRRAVQYWRDVAQHRQALIQDLRSGQAGGNDG